MSMFCFQCQEAAGGTGCTIRGVCGKTEEVSNFQDLLIYVAKGVGYLAHIGRLEDILDQEADRYVFEALFMTITNANFDEVRIKDKIKEGLNVRNALKKKIIAGGMNFDSLPACVMWEPASEEEYADKSVSVGVTETAHKDIRSLKELLIYGLKGMAAYAQHAWTLGYAKDEVFAFLHKGLAISIRQDISAEELVDAVLECGKYGVDVMALLDKANTQSYGHPEITHVNIGVGNRPGILVSGHDLKDLEELLRQSAGKGVDIYTHSEMLPAHYYPAFKKYSHFVGNYGNAWWKQTAEFESFNGPVLLTTNCLVPPRESYKNRVYTTGSAGFSGCTHIPERKDGSEKDFSGLIDHALRCAPPREIEQGEIVGGFAHNQVIQLADKIVDAVKSGAIRKFVVMAGCDGRMKSREYYTQFADQLPSDTVILTAGCAKYRYNKLQLGDIGGIPRILDAGQCNDSYSLAVIALRLKEIFELNDINQLPLVYNLAWYEQKAVIVLLALLHLGVKNIHLGPTLPAFLSPNVVRVLNENFGLSGVNTPENDLVSLVGA